MHWTFVPACDGGGGAPGGTINGAYASFEGTRKGSITAGKLADLVVLGRDPMRVDPMSLIEIPIERTMVGGRRAYES